MGGIRRDLTDKEFYNVRVLYKSGSDKHNNTLWHCKCLECGREMDIASFRINNGHFKGCGHGKTTAKDITGQSVNGWIAKEYVHINGRRKWRIVCETCGMERYIFSSEFKPLLIGRCTVCSNTYGLDDLKNNMYGFLKPITYNRETGKWKCLCVNCGNYTDVLPTNLKNGTTISCGCIRESNKMHVGDKIGTWIIDGFKDDNLVCCTCSKCGFKEELTRSYLYRRSKCSKCHYSGSMGSKYEIEIKKIFGEGIARYRRINGVSEVDMYYPDKKLAIEFNGTYWHSAIMKGKDYHKNKTDACKKESIQLIHIYEYEWKNEDIKNKIIDLINCALYGYKERIYARKTSVCNVSVEDAKVFLKENHLQGYANCSVRIGLKYNRELVGIMTFGKPRFDIEHEWELIRVAFKRNAQVVGGACKIFKHFLMMYKPINIVSYCNRDKFKGTMYEKLGFEFVCNTEPGYVWVGYDNTVLPRYRTTKKKLIKKYGIEDSTNLTEDDIMYMYNNYKIYNSGNAKYVWTDKEIVL